MIDQQGTRLWMRPFGATCGAGESEILGVDLPRSSGGTLAPLSLPRPLSLPNIKYRQRRLPALDIGKDYRDLGILLPKDACVLKAFKSYLQ